MRSTQSASQATTNSFGHVIESGMTVEWTYGSKIIEGIVTGINALGRVEIDRDGTTWTVAPDRLTAVIIID
jgi:hypothetical protein